MEKGGEGSKMRSATVEHGLTRIKRDHTDNGRALGPAGLPTPPRCATEGLLHDA